MRKEYYIVMMHGVPMDVSANPFRAEELAAQMSTRDNKATVLAVVPAQLELPLEDPYEEFTITPATKEGCPKPGCPYFMTHGECNGECRQCP